MTYRVLISRGVNKQLEKCDPVVRERILRGIAELSVDPRSGQVKRLKGSPLWRKRVGDYRVIYAVNDVEVIVQVVEVGHRSRIYR